MRKNWQTEGISGNERARPWPSRRAKGNSRKKNDQAARAISIGQLNALQRLHLRPINVVVYDGSSGGCPREAYS